MKKTGIVMLMLGILLATTTLCHAGWFKDAGRSLGKSSRQISNYSKRTYNNAKDYTNKNKDEWQKKCRQNL